MLLTSFFPLAVLILAVLGSIVFGLATPTEAAAVGAFGGLLLAVGYRYIDAPARARAAGRRSASRSATWAGSSRTRRSSPPRPPPWCAGSSWAPSIFSAAFALLGGQEIIERWVLSLGLTPIQFMILAQFIIFILGWPLEWTEIIVIFMPIFIPLLAKFNIDPLFFGLLVALNLQTAFLSPPVAMAAFYLKGVSPPHVTLNQIFGGMMPFMGIQVVALVLLYMFPEHRPVAAAACSTSRRVRSKKVLDHPLRMFPEVVEALVAALRGRAQRRGPSLAAGRARAARSRACSGAMTTVMDKFDAARARGSAATSR